MALLGLQLSDYQVSLLPSVPSVLVLDQDDPGRIAADTLIARLSDAVKLTLPAKDPAEMSPARLQQFLTAQGYRPMHTGTAHVDSRKVAVMG